MLYSLDVSPWMLEELCKGWSREEILEGIPYFEQAAATDSYYLFHVQVLRDELGFRD